jgi:hypothetical protein
VWCAHVHHAKPRRLCARHLRLQVDYQCWQPATLNKSEKGDWNWNQQLGFRKVKLTEAGEPRRSMETPVAWPNYVGYPPTHDPRSGQLIDYGLKMHGRHVRATTAAIRARTNSRTHPPTHARTHAPTHPRTHASTHARTHALISAFGDARRGVRVTRTPTACCRVPAERVHHQDAASRRGRIARQPRGGVQHADRGWASDALRPRRLLRGGAALEVLLLLCESPCVARVWHTEAASVLRAGLAVYRCPSLTRYYFRKKRADESCFFSISEMRQCHTSVRSLRTEL